MNISLRQYVKKRNGVSMGAHRSLRNNLYRSLGAKNFSSFWNYWNPIFGYYLGKFIFKPLKRTFSAPLSLIFTFVFCGLVHDLVASSFRGKISLFFTIWFFFMSVMVLVSRILKYDFSQQLWVKRALINLSIIALCFLLSLYARGIEL